MATRQSELVADTRTISADFMIDHEIKEVALPLHGPPLLNTPPTETRRVPGAEHAMTRVKPLFAGSVPNSSLPENVPCVATIALPCQIPTGASVVGTVTFLAAVWFFCVGE